MKKCYPFLLKTWLNLGLAATFIALLSFPSKAQIIPTKVWDKTYGGSGFDYLRALQQTSDGGYILGGDSKSPISGNKTQGNWGLSDYRAVKIDALGNKQWDKNFGGNGYDDFDHIQQTTDGGYIMGGSSNSDAVGEKTAPNKGDYDYWVVKLDANGNKQWDKTYGGNLSDQLGNLQQTSDGGYILGGSSRTSINGDKTQATKGDYDYWVIKLDANGNKQWDKSYGTSGADVLRHIQQTADGGYILGGASSSQNGDKSQASKGLTDYWIVKISSNGTKVWEKTFGGGSYDEIQDIKQTPDNGYIVGGWSLSPIGGDKTQANIGDYDYWVLKLTESGGLTWDKTFGGTMQDNFYSVELTPDGGYALGGWSKSGISGSKSQANKGNADFWLVKINANGVKLWDRTFGGNNVDDLFALTKTSDGGYLLGGASGSNAGQDKSQICQGAVDYWAVKLSSDVTGIKESEASFSLSISPNPNQGKFHLQLSNLTAPKAEITVSDLLGRVVLQKELQATNNQLSEEVILPTAKGIYLLQLNAGEQIITRKIVVE